MKKNIGLSLIILPLFSVVFTSCANSSHLLVYQHLNLGLNTAVNPQSGNLHVRFGARKEFASIIPKIERQPFNSNDVVVTKGKGKKNRDLASTYSAMKVRVNRVYEIPEIDEIIASGEAAETISGRSDALEPFVKK